MDGGRFMLLATVLAIAGCAQNPFSASQANQQQQQLQQQQLAQRQQEMLNQTARSNQANQELEALLAQTRQQASTYKEQVEAMQSQLASVTNQLAVARDEKNVTEQRAQALSASVRRAQPTLPANSSVQQNLRQLNLPGLEVRQDGDVVRVELPADKLFDPGTARLRPGANLILDNAALELTRVYPNQTIGVEGHTDADWLKGSSWITNHQLALGQAAAVFEYLSTRMQVRPEQLFIVAHGGNHPVVSNGSPSGKARNRRVELVIYPEAAPQR